MSSLTREVTRGKHDCDLIDLGKHGIHVTEELLLGSVAKRVLTESRGDVLVVMDPRSAEPQPVGP